MVSKTFNLVSGPKLLLMVYNCTRNNKAVELWNRSGFYSSDAVENGKKKQQHYIYIQLMRVYYVWYLLVYCFKIMVAKSVVASCNFTWKEKQ